MMSTQLTYQDQLGITSPLNHFDTSCSVLTNTTDVGSDTTMATSGLSPPLSSSSLSMPMNPMATLATSTPDSDYLVDYGFPQIPISLAGVSLADPTMTNPYSAMSMSLDSPIETAFSGICTTQQSTAAQLHLSAAAAAAAAAIANSCTGTPPTPIPTPTVPSLSKEMSPTDNKFPEFHEYNRLHYEISTDPEAKKRAKLQQQNQQQGPSDRSTAALNAELRRQIHIQSEQKRRAQIKDGFEELRRYLPNCSSNKKVSKSAILGKTVVFIQQLKHNQATLLAELERLTTENDRLKQCVFGPQNNQQ